MPIHPWCCGTVEKTINGLFTIASELYNYKWTFMIVHPNHKRVLHNRWIDVVNVSCIANDLIVMVYNIGYVNK